MADKEEQLQPSETSPILNTPPPPTDPGAIEPEEEAAFNIQGGRHHDRRPHSRATSPRGNQRSSTHHGGRGNRNSRHSSHVKTEQDPLLNHDNNSDINDIDDIQAAVLRRQRRQRVYHISTIAFIAILIIGTSIFALVVGPIYWGPIPLYSNGTDWFAKTVVMISVDGMRADYLDHGQTSILTRMAREGVRAEYMQPSFPSTTFANHYTLVTGLYPESHGIISNTFYDPETNDTFWYTDPARSHDSKWWGGEPIWVTAVKQKQRSAIHMWPGSSSEIAGHRPTYWDPFNKDTTPAQKANRILDWLDMPMGDRPQLIGAYIPAVDTAGHDFGPDSSEVDFALRQVDDMMSRLFNGLEQRNLTDIVNVIVVSDHGMTRVNEHQVIHLDNIIDMTKVASNHGFPLALLTPHSDKDIHSLYQALSKASQTSKFQVYLKESVPKHYHFSANERIPPIVCIPDLGWNFVTGNETIRSKGMHGYDNRSRDMRASFLARGPAIKTSNNVHASGFPNVNVYNLVARILDLSPSINNGSDFWVGSSGILRD
ncbi:alkaline-phosphatase-like protein [Syncephalis fuscata]|nr:alkaline-phosphatase-like protein [Syncephalis fuscata]